MSDSRCTSKIELNKLNDFAEKAAYHKTPKKIIKVPIKLEKHSAIITGQLLNLDSLGLSFNNMKFARSMNSIFEKVDKQFFKLDKIMGEILTRINNFEEVVSTGT